jgi:pyruvate dehydrogenase E2 component (dihydrolipoyllysine-residue acetyltransferase)
MVEFVMPRLGADMSSGRLVEWRRHPGDAVARGDIIAEVETDKGEIEVESFATGIVDQVLVEPGAVVPVGTALATIRTASEPTSAPVAVATGRDTTTGRVRISPSARQLADELHVDLAAVTGSGPMGRIVRRDVEAAAIARAPKPQPSPASPAPPAEPAVTAAPAAARAVPPPPDGDPAARMRAAIAAAMARSKREIPHFYLRTTVDMSAASAWLGDQNAERPVTDRLLYGVLLVKATALALRDVPELNSLWQDGAPVASERIHVGVAVSLRGGGLVAPALHDADRRSLDDLMRGFRDLVNRARSGRLRGSELSDPTITMTSLGERGVEEVYGVIVPPQVAIVGFGRIAERPWVFQGRVLPCPVMTVTLAADHRVTDGHRAGLFLSAVERLLQEPEAL